MKEYNFEKEAVEFYQSALKSRDMIFKLTEDDDYQAVLEYIEDNDIEINEKRLWVVIYLTFKYKYYQKLALEEVNESKRLSGQNDNQNEMVAFEYALHWIQQDIKKYEYDESYFKMLLETYGKLD